MSAYLHPELVTDPPAFSNGQRVKVVAMTTKFNGFVGVVLEHDDGHYLVRLDGWDAHKIFPKLPNPSRRHSVWFFLWELDKA